MTSPCLSFRHCLRRLLEVVLWRTILPIVLVGCGESTAPLKMTPQAFFVEFITPTTVRTAVIEVTAPDIAGSIVANATIDSVGFGSAKLLIPAGRTRRIRVSAVDSFRVSTHRVDTIIDITPDLASVHLRLRPLLSHVRVSASIDRRFSMYYAEGTVTSDGFRYTPGRIFFPVQLDALPEITLYPGEIRTALIFIGFPSSVDVVWLNADSLILASSNPAILSVVRTPGPGILVDAYELRARRPGYATLSISSDGRGVRIPAFVRER